MEEPHPEMLKVMASGKVLVRWKFTGTEPVILEAGIACTVAHLRALRECTVRCVSVFFIDPIPREFEAAILVCPQGSPTGIRKQKVESVLGAPTVAIYQGFREGSMRWTECGIGHVLRHPSDYWCWAGDDEFLHLDRHEGRGVIVQTTHPIRCRVEMGGF